MTGPDYVKVYKRNGNWRAQYRRKGYPLVELPTPKGFRGVKVTLINCPKFLTAYLAASQNSPLAVAAPGAKIAKHGSLAWMIGEFLASLDHKRRSEAMRKRHKRYLEPFRAEF